MAKTIPPFYPSLVRDHFAHDRQKYDKILEITNANLATIHRDLNSKPSADLIVAASQQVSIYAKNVAQLRLQAIAAQGSFNDASTPMELQIRKRIFIVAQKLASINNGLSLAALVDLAVAYSPSNLDALHDLFEVAMISTASHLDAVRSSLIPAFRSTLGKVTEAYTEDGLHRLLKSAIVLEKLLAAGETTFTPLFGADASFISTLGETYETGLGRVATSFGGISTQKTTDAVGGGDEWETKWMMIKVSLLGSLNSILTWANDETAVIATLLAVPAPSTVASTLRSYGDGTKASPPIIPFVTRSLIADFNHAYQRPPNDEVQQAVLESLSDGVSRGDVGGLAILLKDRESFSASQAAHSFLPEQTANVKGKGKASTQEQPQMDVDIALSMVLEIFSDQDPSFIRQCLLHPRFAGSSEAVIAALLEGGITDEMLSPPVPTPAPQPTVSNELSLSDARRNVFDDAPMDYAQLRQGKSRDADAVLEDKEWLAEMKEEILRRAEEVSDSEEGDEVSGKVVAFEEDLDGESDVTGGGAVVNDGEGSEVGEEEAEKPEEPLDAETILELAYIADPKVFDRDAATKRSKPRADLRERTKMDDGQIEGWKLMLERDPKRKEKVLAKHEFKGNVILEGPLVPQASGSGSRHRGRGRGRGGGGGASGGGGGGGTARDRAWKDKNKARAGNHDRKQGHYKKMARGGGPS